MDCLALLRNQDCRLWLCEQGSSHGYKSGIFLLASSGPVSPSLVKPSSAIGIVRNLSPSCEMPHSSPVQHVLQRWGSAGIRGSLACREGGKSQQTHKPTHSAQGTWPQMSHRCAGSLVSDGWASRTLKAHQECLKLKRSSLVESNADGDADVEKTPRRVVSSFAGGPSPGPRSWPGSPIP